MLKWDLPGRIGKKCITQTGTGRQLGVERTRKSQQSCLSQINKYTRWKKESRENCRKVCVCVLNITNGARTTVFVFWFRFLLLVLLLMNFSSLFTLKYSLSSLLSLYNFSQLWNNEEEKKKSKWNRGCFPKSATEKQLQHHYGLLSATVKYTATQTTLDLCFEVSQVQANIVHSKSLS